MDFMDLRNDNAGGELDQAKSIILRYLENAPYAEFVDTTNMLEDIGRHWPFQGEGEATFQEAIKDLEAGDLIVSKGERLQINKVAHVVHMWNLRAVRGSR
jgi:hypothetical protein